MLAACLPSRLLTLTPFPLRHAQLGLLAPLSITLEGVVTPLSLGHHLSSCGCLLLLPLTSWRRCCIHTCNTWLAFPFLAFWLEAFAFTATGNKSTFGTQEHRLALFSRSAALTPPHEGLKAMDGRRTRMMSNSHVSYLHQRARPFALNLLKLTMHIVPPQ